MLKMWLRPLELLKTCKSKPTLRESRGGQLSWESKPFTPIWNLWNLSSKNLSDAVCSKDTTGHWVLSPGARSSWGAPGEIGRPIAQPKKSVFWVLGRSDIYISFKGFFLIHLEMYGNGNVIVFGHRTNRTRLKYLCAQKSWIKTLTTFESSRATCFLSNTYDHLNIKNSLNHFKHRNLDCHRQTPKITPRWVACGPLELWGHPLVNNSHPAEPR